MTELIYISKERSVLRFYQLISIILFMVLACLPIWLLTASADSSAQPQWVSRYLYEERPQWDGWRNSLQPQGELSAPLPLAIDGETDYRIIIPGRATAPERRAAIELRQWLGKITGADFPIVDDGEPARPRELSVGRTNRVTESEMAKLGEAGSEGYVIAVEDERIYLLGAGPAGPLHAAFALLEEDLGVRWYQSNLRHGDWHELQELIRKEPWSLIRSRVPENPSLRIGIVPRVVQPGYAVRQLTWRLNHSPWALLNRVNFGYIYDYGQQGYASGELTSHTFHKLVPPDQYFESNPEYYSLIDGERRWERAQLCLSNPEVAAVAAETAIDYLRNARENHRMIDVSPEDWGNDCQCDECRAIEEKTGTYSGLLMQFINQITEKVTREFPDAKITTLVYRQSKTPPPIDIDIHPNVAIRFCTDFGASFNWPYHSFYDPKVSDQREMFERWRGLSERMQLWIYPHQYRERLAPMPNIRPVAENIRFFSDQQAEAAYIEQHFSQDFGREPMRFWVFSKLLWDPTLDVDELMLDFIWGNFGEAAPAVIRYHELLWDHCVQHTDFNRERNWIYPIHNEPMYQHGFIEEAREILDQGLAMADDEEIYERVEALKAGVVYVEAVQHYIQMRDGDIPPDPEQYQAIQEELREICERIGVRTVGYYDGSDTIWGVRSFTQQMAQEQERRIGTGMLGPEYWGTWTFRPDPEGVGRDRQWYSPEQPENLWREIKVPALWSQTWVGDYLGYGWYRTTFTVPAEHEGTPLELEFGGVDEQAWVYVNGEYAGEHTLESEFMVGEDITVDDLWNRPFRITVSPDLLKPDGENQLVVLVHASNHNGGIHQPVRIWLMPEE